VSANNSPAPIAVNGLKRKSRDVKLHISALYRSNADEREVLLVGLDG
jgi:hypothetical protein